MTLLINYIILIEITVFEWLLIINLCLKNITGFRIRIDILFLLGWSTGHFCINLNKSFVIFQRCAKGLRQVLTWICVSKQYILIWSYTQNLKLCLIISRLCKLLLFHLCISFLLNLIFLILWNLRNLVNISLICLKISWNIHFVIFVSVTLVIEVVLFNDIGFNIHKWTLVKWPLLCFVIFGW